MQATATEQRSAARPPLAARVAQAELIAWATDQDSQQAVMDEIELGPGAVENWGAQWTVRDGEWVCLTTTIPPRPGPDPWEEIIGLLDQAQRLLEKHGWAPEGSDDLRGPHSLTEALTVAAFPAGASDHEDEDAAWLFAATWQELARTSTEELGVPLPRFEAEGGVDLYHITAFIECTRLRLRIR